MRKMLIRVRASKGSSITTDSSYAYYLRPPKCRRLEKIRTKYARQMTTISDDKRNALLVVAALLIAVTYQAALSPPGGLQETIKKPDKDCCDAPCAKWKTNADSWRTTQISTSQADGPDGYIGLFCLDKNKKQASWSRPMWFAESFTGKKNSQAWRLELRVESSPTLQH
nr:hypothetical protein CFP56_38262 [Quercus suber]